MEDKNLMRGCDMLLRKFYFCSDQVKNKLISAYFVFAIWVFCQFIATTV